MLYCPNFFWNVFQVWMTGKDVYLQMTWSWPDKTWNILCSYCLQWNTSQSKFRNHYFLFLFAFSILSQLFLIWGCNIEYASLFIKHNVNITTYRLPAQNAPNAEWFVPNERGRHQFHLKLIRFWLYIYSLNALNRLNFRGFLWREGNFNCVYNVCKHSAFTGILAYIISECSLIIKCDLAYVFFFPLKTQFYKSV